MLTSITIIVSLIAQSSQETSVVDHWQTMRAANGVLVHVCRVVDAPKQSTFTFLPIGLVSDPLGHAQYSHLAEHMLIRSTDPKKLHVDGIAINGETTARVMRLETIADPEQWEPALRRHARWLVAREFDESSLAREKVMVEGEERATVEIGQTHKWAFAAWAQVMRGRDHVAIHGDVANATVGELTKYVAASVRVSAARIFSIGPQSGSDQFAAIQDEFSRSSIVEELTESDAPSTQDAVREATGHFACTWDLCAHHYLEWYALPVESTVIEAHYIGQILAAAIYQNQQLRSSAVCLAVTMEGRNYVLLSVSVADDQSLEQIQSACRVVVSRSGPAMLMQLRGAQWRDQLLAYPDFASQRKKIRNPRFRDLIETQYALNVGYACIRGNTELENIASAVGKLKGTELREQFKAATSVTQRASVMLAPK